MSHIQSDKHSSSSSEHPIGYCTIFSEENARGTKCTCDGGLCLLDQPEKQYQSNDEE